MKEITEFKKEGATTFSKTTFSIVAKIATLEITFMFLCLFLCYANCRYAKCRYVECRDAKKGII
jgi:hypothetical protein